MPVTEVLLHSGDYAFQKAQAAGCTRTAMINIPVGNGGKPIHGDDWGMVY